MPSTLPRRLFFRLPQVFIEISENLGPAQRNNCSLTASASSTVHSWLREQKKSLLS
jgi:hypothetical protein